jgi:hypothetical protein
VKTRTTLPSALVLALTLAAAGRAQESAVPAPPTGTPTASFEKTEIDAGDVTRGKEVPVSFVVRNTGDAVLKILSAKPG